jgi:hypothetical protein
MRSRLSYGTSGAPRMLRQPTSNHAQPLPLNEVIGSTWLGNRVRLLAFASLIALGSGLGLLKYLILAKVLSVEDFGYYGLVLLVLPFGVYLSHWGTLHSLNVNLPIAYGRGDGVIDRTINGVFGIAIATTVISTTTYFVVIRTLPFSDKDAQLALTLATATILLTGLTDFYALVLRVQRRLVPLGAVTAFRGVVTVGLSAAGAALWGFAGAIGFEFCALAMTLALGAALLPRLRPRRPDRRETAALVIAGAPLLAADLITAARYTTDRLFVAAAIPQELGQYTLASIVTIAFVVLYAVLYQGLVPQLLYEHGAGLSLRRIRCRLRRFAVTVIGFGALGFPVIIALTRLLRDGPFSEYATGLDAVPILYAGGVAGLLTLYSVLLLAARRFYLTVVSTGLGAIVAVAGGLFLSLGEPSVNDFATLFLVSQLVSAVATIVASELVVTGTA